MFRSRPVQYLGLLLLVLACLGVIFFPIGAPPQSQPYTLTFAAAKPFDQLAPKPAKGEAPKTATDLVDAAFVKEFPANSDHVPVTGLVYDANSKTATISDKATTRDEAQNRAEGDGDTR